jgi:hypothetical protein
MPQKSPASGVEIRKLVPPLLPSEVPALLEDFVSEQSALAMRFWNKSKQPRKTFFGNHRPKRRLVEFCHELLENRGRGDDGTKDSTGALKPPAFKIVSRSFEADLFPKRDRHAKNVGDLTSIHSSTLYRPNLSLFDELRRAKIRLCPILRLPESKLGTATAVNTDERIAFR